MKGSKEYQNQVDWMQWICSRNCHLIEAFLSFTVDSLYPLT